MKRKILSIILLGCMVLSLVGCSNTDNADIGSNRDNNVQASELEGKTDANDSVDESKNDNTISKEFEITDDSVFEEITYEVGGFEFYCPKVFKNGAPMNGLGFLLNKKDFDVLTAYGKWEQGEYNSTRIEERYFVLTLTQGQVIFNEKDEEIASSVTLDNIVELTKEEVLRFFVDRYYLLGMSQLKIDMFFEKSEKVKINGIEMLKVEGFFKDLDELKENKPFFAYYMISVDEKGNRIPVQYIGFPSDDGTYEEVVNYMDTYIHKVKLVK